MSKKFSDHLTWTTLFAWAPILWYFSVAIWFTLTAATRHDWPCGPPGHEVCDFPTHYAGTVAALNVTALMAVALWLWTGVQAMRRKLNPLGVAGLVCSLAGVVGFVLLYQAVG